MESDLVPSPAAVVPDSRSSRGSTLVLAATVFLSAWLLFQVQPMVAKRILPWFGGGPAVWTTTMLFFQTALLAGYFYAHVLASRLTPKRQFGVHVALLAGTAVLLIFSPAIPSDSWKPTESSHPAWDILVLLTATIGPPYILLAATAPLVQAWYAGSDRAGSPYRLYALSNVGSLAALLTYPLLVEPRIGIVRQGLSWSVLFGIFAMLCGASGWALTRGGADAPSEESPESEADAPPSKLRRFLWVAFPACASVVLLAVTNYLTQDVASFPLMWIIPLAVYLMTFIATFDSDRWYLRIVWMPLAAAASFGAAHSWIKGSHMDLKLQVAYQIALLLSLGMVCHGEVVRQRPGKRRLTSFYLAIAGGGALGGILAGLVAPLVLPDRYEFQLAIVAVWILAMIALATDRKSPLYDGRTFPAWIAIVASLVVFAVVVVRFYTQSVEPTVARVRNFYGVLRVSTANRDSPLQAYRKLTNGRISHGAQYVAADNRRFPAGYYWLGTGVSQALVAMPAGRPHRVGVVGLGAGVLASYAEKGDYFAFYDINPLDVDVAEKYFTFLADARERGADITIVQGDARLSLERQPPQNYDVLVLDAFSGDAIPVHLLTREAIDLAVSHLAKPDGVLVVHISNLHLDLQPVVNAAAKRHDMEATRIYTYAQQDPASLSADWVLLTADKGRFADAPDARPLVDAMGSDRTVEWTDDYSNLLDILK